MLKEEICDPNFSEQKDAANLASLTDVNLKFNIFPNIFNLLSAQAYSSTHLH
jgi:hypothetical protein